MSVHRVGSMWYRKRGVKISYVSAKQLVFSLPVSRSVKRFPANGGLKRCLRRQYLRRTMLLSVVRYWAVLSSVHSHLVQNLNGWRSPPNWIECLVLIFLSSPVSAASPVDWTPDYSWLLSLILSAADADTLCIIGSTQSYIRVESSFRCRMHPNLWIDVVILLARV